MEFPLRLLNPSLLSEFPRFVSFDHNKLFCTVFVPVRANVDYFTVFYIALDSQVSAYTYILSDVWMKA